jgi:hypothetical protein
MRMAHSTQPLKVGQSVVTIAPTHPTAALMVSVASLGHQVALLVVGVVEWCIHNHPTPSMRLAVSPFTVI